METIQIIHATLEIWGSIFCLIAAFFTFMCSYYEPEKRKAAIGMQLTIATLLIADALAWGFRGYPGKVGYYAIRICNFIVFFMSNVMLMYYHSYVCCFILYNEKGEQVKKKPLRVYLVYIIGMIGILILSISQYTHWYYNFDSSNRYHRNALYPLSIVIMLIGMSIDLTLLIQYRKRIGKATFLALCSYIVLPVIGSLLLVFYYGISFVNIAVTVSVIYMFISGVFEQKSIMEKKEKEMADLRIEVMLSQISPHFIYNTLTAIKYLCTQDSKQAEETVGEFAAYLRHTIDSLTAKENIPFEKELGHVKNYLAIEKKRFGDLVHIEYEITEKDFLIPTLTLQPIIENAIKYGIGKKEEGGTIRIGTSRTQEFFLITVKDDGIGFDPDKIKEDGRNHIGIRNVRSRLESMCNGSLEIESVVGKGTVATIKVPVEFSI